jgi:hypothetical protein
MPLEIVGEKRDAPPPVVEIRIAMDGGGNVSITGPLENKILMYGLLETAKEIVQGHSTAAREERRIQLAPGAMAAALRKQ